VIPRALRACWWGLVVADAMLVASEIELALLLGRPCGMALWLLGPLFCGATLALMAWWYTRGAGRRLWGVRPRWCPIVNPTRVTAPARNHP
jgi:hypothetical protein